MNIRSLPPILHPLSDFMDYIFLVNILDGFIHDFILIRSKRLSIISYNISKITCELWFCVEPLHHFMPFFLFKIAFNGCIDNIWWFTISKYRYTLLSHWHFKHERLVVKISPSSAKPELQCLSQSHISVIEFITPSSVKQTWQFLHLTSYHTAVFTQQDMLWTGRIQTGVRSP